MNSKKVIKIKSYYLCATRLENRGNDPPSFAYTDNLVQLIKSTGIEAVWHSAVSQQGRPLFPSRIFPNVHPDASYEAFHYLINKVHAIGRPILSWYALNHSISIVEKHPDWKIIPVQGGDIHDAHPSGVDEYPYCCINSPYGKMLPEFCKEIVRDLGFDGIWFDGSTWAINNNSIPGCLCNFCREKFKKETGLDLPQKPDFNSRTFKKWILWRYNCLMAVWENCVDAIHAARNDAIVCFNNYRRYREVGWHTAIPMRRLGWDAIIAGELDLMSFHGDFQMKMHRAYECKHLPESWMALCDYWMLWAPDLDCEPPIQAVVSCIGGGGYMSMGADNVHLMVDVLKKVQKKSARLAQYAGGEIVEYAAVLASQNTQDFYYCEEPINAWKAWHGANDLCNCTHLQSSIIFDDHVESGMLDKYPVILAGNFACISDQQFEQLRRYVENGGVLFLSSDAGTRKEDGEIRKRGIFDEILGIKKRKKGKTFATLVTGGTKIPRFCNKYLSFRMPHNIFELYNKTGIIANLITWDMGGFLDKSPKYDGAGLWFVKHGKGYIIYSAVDMFLWHHDAPARRYTDFFYRLLTSFVEPEIAFSNVPQHVVINTRRKHDKEWFVVLHNAPGNVHRYKTNYGVGPLSRIEDIKIRFRNKKIDFAVSELNGEKLKVFDKCRAICVPPFRRVEVIKIKFK